MNLLGGRRPYLQHHTPDADARGRNASRNGRYYTNLPGVSTSINSPPDKSNKRRQNVICAALWILGRVPHLVDAIEFEETRDGGEAQLSCILRKLSRKEILTDTSQFREAMENAGAYLAACDTQCYENMEPMDTVRGIVSLCADSQAILERTSQAIYSKEVECSRRECNYREATSEVELELRCRLPNATAQGTVDFRYSLRTKTKCPNCGMGALKESWCMKAAPHCLVVTWGTLLGVEPESEMLRVPRAGYSDCTFKFKLAAMSVLYRRRLGCMFRHDNNFYFVDGDSVIEVQKNDWLNAKRWMAIYTLRPSLDHSSHAVFSRSEPKGVGRRPASSMLARDPGKRRRTDGKPSGVLPSARRRASMPHREVIDVEQGDGDTTSGVGANHGDDGQNRGASRISILSTAEVSGRTVGDIDGDDADPSRRRRTVHLGRAPSGGATGRYRASQETTSPGGRQVSNAESIHSIVDGMDVEEEEEDGVASFTREPIDRQRNAWKPMRLKPDSSPSSKQGGGGGIGVRGDDWRSLGEVSGVASRGGRKKVYTTSNTGGDDQLIHAEACCSSNITCAGGSAASVSSISGRNHGVAASDEAMPRDRALALKSKDKEETLCAVMGTPGDVELAVLSKNRLSGTKNPLSQGADEPPSVFQTFTNIAVRATAAVVHITAAATAAAVTYTEKFGGRDSISGSPSQPSSLSVSKSPDAETHERDSKQGLRTQSTGRRSWSVAPADEGRCEEKSDGAEEREKAPQESPRGKAAVDRAVASADSPQGQAKDGWEGPREEVNRLDREEGSDKHGTLDKTEDLTQEVELLREKEKDPGSSAGEGKEERSKKGCDGFAKGGGRRGKAKLTKIRGIALLDEHFCRIIDDNGWLTSQIIDIRVKQLQEAYPENLYFNSSFFGFLCPKSDKDGAFVVDYPRVRGWTKSSRLPDGKSSLFDMKKIFIPINQGNVHWVLAVVDLDARKAAASGASNKPGADEADEPEMVISFFDSLGRDGSAYVEAIQEYLVSELSYRAKMRHGKFSLKPRPAENAPRQQLNSSDCGILVLHVMQKLSTGSTEGLRRLSRKEILDLRLKLMEDIHK